ncbi:hypothetical protein, partial [Pseudomonas aeruginosa]
RLDVLRRERYVRASVLENTVAELRADVWFTLLRLTEIDMATHVLITGTRYTLHQFVTDKVFDVLMNQAGP